MRAFLYTLITSCIGISLNVLLLITMAKVKKRLFGAVQTIFSIMAVVNIFSLLSYFGLSPLLFCYEGRIVLLSDNFYNFPFISDILIKNMFASNTLSVFSLSQCYFFRYILMNKTDIYNFIISWKGVTLNIIFTICWTSLAVVTVNVVFYPTPETLQFLEETDRFKQFHILQNLGFAASLRDIIDDNVRIISFFLYFLDLTFLIVVIFLCSKKIFKSLEDLKRDKTSSRSTIGAHERLLRILFIQTFLPFISFLFPSACLGFLLLSRVTSPELLTFLIASLFPFSIILFPISIIYFIDQYKKYVIQLLFCKKVAPTT